MKSILCSLGFHKYKFPDLPKIELSKEHPEESRSKTCRCGAKEVYLYRIYYDDSGEDNLLAIYKVINPGSDKQIKEMTSVFGPKN
jgi:hypothetical protein